MFGIGPVLVALCLVSELVLFALFWSRRFVLIHAFGYLVCLVCFLILATVWGFLLGCLRVTLPLHCPALSFSAQMELRGVCVYSAKLHARFFKEFKNSDPYPQIFAWQIGWQLALWFNPIWKRIYLLALAPCKQKIKRINPPLEGDRHKVGRRLQENKPLRTSQSSELLSHF